ncbi:MAG: nucleotidyl transferase AbiEii/AbiGii toxin family protein [Candidatus Taylorbacteria bacterium]|nr:nucleotidyl transferase AbiEii/AbiGii toxin family protein [Candidatus Taylorbacteria bacterium]
MPILSEDQKKILALVADDETLAGAFYLTGGTALAEYYLGHRLSEDLGFFAEEEFEPLAISAFFKKIETKAGIRKITYEQSFNRNLFFLELKSDGIKTEFTYFPFPRIEKGKKIGKLDVDSLLDIAVNKLFTIYQKPRTRDFIDLYCILQKEKTWTLDDLIVKAQIKFDHFLEPLQLSGQFTKAETLKDYPKMLQTLPDTEWQSFFMSEAKRIAQKQLE